MKFNKLHTGKVLVLSLALVAVKHVSAQKKDSAHVTVAAGPQYDRSTVHNFLWGKHYRKEWKTPVMLPKLMLDTARGGLTPYESGGSRQTKSLRLKDENEREYVLRSIDKTFGGALPQLYQNTFIEKLINDQVSIAHPYGAVIVAPMAEAAGIYHTWPANYFLPEQEALDSFNNDFSNELYLLEQRPDGNWETAPNFGYCEKIIGTEKLFEHLHENNKHLVDQEAFVRARLFDMFVGDWGRHEDQWRWASFKAGDAVIYKPIPRDRDQAFTKFDGVLLKFVKAAAGLSHQQSFGPVIKNIQTYNYAARNLDRVMTNQLTLQQWRNMAKELQTRLTDTIIANAVKQMPPEVYDISGPGFISNLKSRRQKLVDYAEGYYKFLSKEVDVTGSDKNEFFEITDDGSDIVHLTIYELGDDGNRGRILYQRSFKENETSELRVYGLNGKDRYQVNLSGKAGVNVRIVGGPGNDEYNIASNGKLHVYDNNQENIVVTGKADLNLSSDTSIHEYRYEAFKYNKQGISPSLHYSKQQHIIYFGLAYNNTKYKWRKQPFASSHQMYFHYSPTQHATRTGYDGVINKFAGNWNLLMNANYDWVKVINFFGVGNETQRVTSNRDFYRLRSESGYVAAGLSHDIGAQGNVIFFPFFQTVKLINDADRFLIKDFLQGNFDREYFKTKKFAGVGASLRLQKVDDQIVPTKGYRFVASAAYTKNIQAPKDFVSTGTDLHFYFPFGKRFVFAFKNGFANTTGDAEFYQLNPIGGRRLRGYRRERFWGNTAYYNNNELQYLFNFKSFLFNGKAGLMAFADQGRVWSKGETSNTWHYGYGGGIIIAPFNKIFIAAMYGTSPENKRIIHLDLRRSLK